MSEGDGLKLLQTWHDALPKAERLAELWRRAEAMPPVCITVGIAVEKARVKAYRRARKERDDLIAEILKVDAELALAEKPKGAHDTFPSRQGVAP